MTTAEDSEINEVLGATYRENLNATSVYLSATRMGNYTSFLRSALHEVIMGDIDESTEKQVSEEECVQSIYTSMFKSCDYYIPVMDHVFLMFQTICHNRGFKGLVKLDFDKVCKKQCACLLKRFRLWGVLGIMVSESL